MEGDKDSTDNPGENYSTQQPEDPRLQRVCVLKQWFLFMGFYQTVILVSHCDYVVVSAKFEGSN